MNEPREYTEEEVRNMFLDRVWSMVKYWREAENAREHDLNGKLRGLAFSILAMLDRESPELPKFIVAPDPHPEDSEFNKNIRKENWFPSNCRRL